MTFDCEYDFGSTTELMITVTNYRTGVGRKEKLVILSRNNPIEFLCDECGKKPAVYICAECLYEGNGWLCEDCAKTHKCGEEMLLPVCNSPRMGVCGYCGNHAVRTAGRGTQGRWKIIECAQSWDITSKIVTYNAGRIAMKGYLSVTANRSLWKKFFCF